MSSSVKPWALLKVVNFSFSSSFRVWVLPGTVRRGLRQEAESPAPHPFVMSFGSGLGLFPTSVIPPVLGQWAGTPTIESGHAEVLAWAFGASAEQQCVLIVVGLHH